MSAVPPPSPESLPGPEIDPSPAPDEAPASPSPEMPYPPQPAESPALPPAEAPAQAPAEMPASPPVATPTLPPPTPITGRAWVARGAFALVAALALAPAHAQVSNPIAPPVAPAGAAAPVNAADHRFMDEATASGMVEIVLGRLAVEKGVGEPTRRVGQQMVDDHIKANESLKAMAAAKGVRLPTGLTAEEKAQASRMKKLKGVAFDRQYLTKMVGDHQKAVNLFAQAAGTAADADVKAFAQANLPTLRTHLQMAKEASAVPVAAPKRGTAARE